MAEAFMDGLTVLEREKPTDMAEAKKTHEENTMRLSSPEEDGTVKVVRDTKERVRKGSAKFFGTADWLVSLRPDVQDEDIETIQEELIDAQMELVRLYDQLSEVQENMQAYADDPENEDGCQQFGKLSRKTSTSTEGPQEIFIKQQPKDARARRSSPLPGEQEPYDPSAGSETSDDDAESGEPLEWKETPRDEHEVEEWTESQGDGAADSEEDELETR
eukprot:TRINITY_DN4702_c0_g1_i6.p1 TRINITY_DN4702_c0_g1~~TRINITY_DN4702_c0_g1_i6.p1  ORF type:complete len:218 (+),score=61.51 TRINITY_DN4702_c0_g1_i6:320-973(+)